MIAATKTGRLLFWLTSIAVALASWRFFVLGMEAGFPNMVHQLNPPRVMFTVHVLTGPLALLIIPFQLSDRFRARRPGLHRWFGRVYCVMVLLGGVSGMSIAFSALGGIPGKSGFFMLSVLWLATTAMATVHIRAGRVAEHRVWMIRSAALTFAAVTLRIWLPAQLAAGIPMEVAYPVVAWACWVPNLLIGEYIARRPARATRRAGALARG